MPDLGAPIRRRLDDVDFRALVRYLRHRYYISSIGMKKMTESLSLEHE